MVSLVHDDEYPMNEGRIGSLDGWHCDVADFEQQFEERQVPHSTALHAVRRQSNRSYLVGPLARVNLNRQQLSPTARRIADELKIAWPCRDIFQSIIARGLELIHAFEEACQIITDYRPAGPAWIPYKYRAASGAAATEAPRGLLYHRYGVDEAGKITLAKIVPPTSQNQAQIEADLRQFIPQSPAADDDAALTLQCEHLVRSYDPCISCSTHFLKVKVDRA
jgi:coenzyme F420-reducing hydrogenase alpha subunit